MYIKGKKAHNLVDNPIEQYKSSSAHLTAAGNNALESEVSEKYTEHNRRGVHIYNPHNRSIQLWFYSAYITERIKLPTFIYLLFLFTTQAFIRRKDYIYIRISVYFDHFIRVVYERRYASHMLHHHLCTVRYSGSRYGGRR